MSAHVLLNLLVNELGEKIRCECKILFINVALKSHFICDVCIKRQEFALENATILWTSTHNFIR